MDTLDLSVDLCALRVLKFHQDMSCCLFLSSSYSAPDLPVPYGDLCPLFRTEKFSSIISSLYFLCSLFSGLIGCWMSSISHFFFHIFNLFFILLYLLRDLFDIFFYPIEFFVFTIIFHFPRRFFSACLTYFSFPIFISFEDRVCSQMP